MPRETYIIKINRHPDIMVCDMKDYIKEALQCWGGQFAPPGADPEYPEGDPRFYSQKPVTVKRVK